ncbi:MAG: SHOCT domain-containing protein [Clostridia bacterium]
MGSTIYVVSGLIGAVIFGIATQKIIRDKGYDDNWFIWGFLFGFIALIVAASKPLESEKVVNVKESNFKNGEWLCTCGTVNQVYNYDCKCGQTKQDVMIFKQNNKSNNIPNTIKTTNKSIVTADDLLKLKQLLDAGIITQDEFDAKKNKFLEQ